MCQYGLVHLIHQLLALLVEEGAQTTVSRDRAGSDRNSESAGSSQPEPRRSSVFAAAAATPVSADGGKSALIRKFARNCSTFWWKSDCEEEKTSKMDTEKIDNFGETLMVKVG